MINLLSENERFNLQAARLNVTLLKYVIILLVATVCIAMIYGFGYINTIQARDAAKARDSDYAAQSAELSDVAAEAKSFREKLSSADEIIGSQIALSQVATAIAGSLPSYVVIDTLNVSVETINEPISLTLFTRSIPEAALAKDELEASPAFEDVQIQSATDESGDTVPLEYLPSHTVRVTMTMLLTLDENGKVAQ